MKKYLNYILLGFIIFLISIQYVIFAYLYYNHDKKINVDLVNNISSEITYEPSDISKFYVEIKGAVNKPGVYELYSNNIINDLVNAAGGFKSNAYTNNINLSKYLSSQMVIYVYTKYEYSLLDKKNDNQSECNCSNVNLDNCLKNGSSVINANEGSSDFISNSEDNDKSSKININTASLEELTTLNGIGESKAKSIIEYRKEHGNFNSIDDLKNISGISDKIFEKIKDNITI